MLGDVLETALVGSRAETRDLPRNWVSLWVWTLCCLVFAMVILGGATRLTDSGLSMVEWRVFELLPPSTPQEWQEMFYLYTSSPEYTHRNLGMTLDGFKDIFWLEYVHRLSGRAIGAVLLIPFFVFYLKGRIDRHLAWRMGALFALGGAQGALGWFMVASGLIDEPHVSHYRLAAHLLLAVFLFAALLWTALECTFGRFRFHVTHICAKLVLSLLALTCLTITWGAFVAGLDAGLVYNTFPFMDGQLIPKGLGIQMPLWLNAFENITTVQFLHRFLGSSTAFFACITAGFMIVYFRHSAFLRRCGFCLGVVAVIQAGLGVATLLFSVPLSLGLIHQGGALVLVGLLVTVLFHIARDQSDAIGIGS